MKHPAAKGCTDDDTLAIVPIYKPILDLISWRIIQIESQMLQTVTLTVSIVIDQYTFE
jgi:hypothetical protein